MDSAVIQSEMDDQKGQGVDLDLRLHDAVCDPDDFEEIESLVQNEPHLVYLKDKGGRTPLHTLVIDADEMAPQIAKILLGVSEESGVIRIERSDLLNVQDADHYTALHYAAVIRRPSLVLALLKWGADPYIQNRQGNTPLHLAAEGLQESAIECATHLLKNDNLINMVNCKNKTALHTAIDKKSTQVVKFLLTPENKYNVSLKDENGKNLLHYVCSGTEESDETCDIVKAIVNRFSPPHLNEVDHLQRTALHWAAVERLPKITRILVEDENTDVLKVDKSQKTALHYACQNGCYPRGHACVDVLIGQKMAERIDQVKYLFRNEDNEGQTPFTYACLNCPSSTIKNYLTIVSQPQYWLTAPYIALLYKECPQALTALMDNSISEDRKSSEFEEDFLVDYGSITGYKDHVENEPPQPETKYLKEALEWDYETQRQILLHPLVQLFILKKWQKLGWIIALWVLSQLIWLGAYTTLVLSFYRGSERSSLPAAYLTSALMLIYILSSLVNELFECWTAKMAYFLSATNIGQFTRNIFAFISIYPVLIGVEEPMTWQKYVAATGILLSYILSMRDIGKLHNKIGLVVEVLKQVLIQIVQVLACCSPLWIGFTLAFVIIFEDDESLNSSFPGPIVKVLVMMTGEFEYKDTFNGNGEKKVLATYAAIRLLFFLIFLISVPVAFFNLLTGFALDKVMELRERAKVGRMAKQLEHIHSIESILLILRPIMSLLFSYDRVVTWVRKHNVTTEWIDQKLTFFTIQKEKIRQSSAQRIRKKKEGKVHAGKCWSWRNCFAFWEFKLGHDVVEEIYALASSNPSTQL